MPFNDPLPAQVIGDNVAMTVGGLRAFSDPEKDLGDFFTRIHYKSAYTALLEKIALNLAAAPKEQTRFVYTGRYEDVPAACDVLTSELFEQVSRDETVDPS